MFLRPLNDPTFVLSRLIMRRNRYRAMNLNIQQIQKEIDTIIRWYPHLKSVSTFNPTVREKRCKIFESNS